MVFGKVGGFAGVVDEVEELRFFDFFDHAAPPAEAVWVGGSWEDEFPFVDPDAGEEAAAVVEVAVARAFFGFAEEEGGGVVAIEGAVIGEGGTGEFGEGGEEVEGGEDFIAGRTRGDFAGPAGDERDARAAFPSGHFPATEGSRRAGVVAGDEGFAAGFRAASGFDPGAIVGGEDDERFSVELEFLEFFEDLPGGPIDLFNGIAVGTVCGAVFELGGRSEGNVRHVVGEVEEEGFVFVFLEVGEGFTGVVGGDGVPVFHF